MSATLSQSMGNSNGWRCQQLLCSSDGKRVVKVRAGFPARLACRLQNTWQPAHQRFPQSVTPTRSRLVWRQGGRHVHAPVPSCSLDVEVWRPQGLRPEILCRAASATPAVFAPQPTRYGTQRRPGPRTRRREWGCSILLPAAKFKCSGSPCRPNNRRQSGMASTSTFPHVVNARFHAGGSRPSHGPATDAMTTEGASRLVARRILPCPTPRRSFSSPFRCC